MALLGAPLVVVLTMLAVLVPVATLLLWSRVRGPATVQAACRLGMLLGAQLVSVLLVAVLANDYGQFYSSWSDLVGTSGGGGHLSTYGAGAPVPARGAAAVHGELSPAQIAAGTGASSGTLGRLRLLGGTGWSPRSQWSSRGAVETVSVSGLGSGLSEQGYVYLPPQYFRQAWAGHRFPAVEVLTGYPGSPQALVDRLDYPGLALAAVRAHRSVPMIYVMLSSTVAPPRDTECTDVPHGPQALTFLAQEVPNAVESGLRVQQGAWGVVGDSTGGYCATKIAMTHDAEFRAAVSLSGYYFALHDVTTGNLWGGSRTLRHLNSPQWMLAHRPAPPVSLFVTIGKQETKREGYPDTMKFLSLVKPPMRVTALIEPHGGHNFRTWDAELPTALHWLSNRLSAHP